MRKTAIMMILLLIPALVFAETDEMQDGIDALSGTIDLSEWDAWLREAGVDEAILPSELFGQLLESRTPQTLEPTAGGIAARFAGSLKPTLAKTALLMGLAVLGACLNGLTDTSSIGETAQTVFRVCTAAAVLAVLLAEIRTATQAISATEHTAELLLPVIVGFLTLNGMENTAALLPSTNALLSDLVLRLTEAWIVPLSVIGGVLTALDAGSAGRLASIGRLMQRAAKWILGISCSVYLTVTAIRSGAAGGADGLLLKTARLAAGSIPAVGSLLSESVETGLYCLRFVRNALGLTGCIVLISVAAKPILSVFLSRSCLRAASMLSEPLAGKPYAELLRGIGDTLHILMLCEFAAAAAVLLMLAPVFLRGGAV